MTTPTELFLAAVRARDRLTEDAAALLRVHGLTSAQYNVLRILRGAESKAQRGATGLPCRVIGERLLTRGPDVTRLVDGLLRAGWVERARASADRRVVEVRLLPAARRLLEDLDEPVRDLHERQFARLTDAEREQLLGLLECVGLRDPN